MSANKGSTPVRTALFVTLEEGCIGYFFSRMYMYVSSIPVTLSLRDHIDIIF